MDSTKPITDVVPHAHSAHFFTNSKSTSIYGSNFMAVGVVNNRISGRDTKDPFEHLQEHVATSAFHNSAMRINPPRCHRNTRVAVIDGIFKWISKETETTREEMMLWLTGAAGAGKSAVGQSVAEMCSGRGVLTASFFFSRTDATRNSSTQVIPTLAYQLVKLVPLIKNAVLGAIESNPLIFQQSFEAQAEELIFQPLAVLEQSHVSWKMLIIIDGVDECTEDVQQSNMVLTLAKLLLIKNLPQVMVMFSSREEHRLKMAFNKVVDIVHPIRLDERYLPQSDIRLFLSESFLEIKRTHPFCHFLDHRWPEDHVLEEIVQKSSGQFIYSAVVMKFLFMPDSNPAQQLEIVRGLRPSGEESPFAQLDTLYQHIFSGVKRLELVMAILAYIILGDDPNLISLSRLLGVPQSELEVSLVALSSVISCQRKNNHPPTIVLLHESMTDFFLDKKRSGDKYYLDASTWSKFLLIRWFHNVGSDRTESKHFSDNSHAIAKLLRYATGSKELRDGVMNFNPENVSHNMLVDFLGGIQKIDFDDDGAAYLHQLRLCTRVLWGLDPGLLCALLDSGHSTIVIMSVIASEIRQTREGRATTAREEEHDRKARLGNLEMKEREMQRTAFREFDERERKRRAEERLKYDRAESLRRKTERKDFDEREQIKRSQERNLYVEQEIKWREEERNRFYTAEAKRRKEERRDYYSQEEARREELKALSEKQEEVRRELARRESDKAEEERRVAIQKEFDELEESRREATRQEFDKAEEERRAAIQKEFEMQEETRREAIRQEFDRAEEERRTAIQKEFDELEENRREATKREFDKAEEERRAGIRKEFDIMKEAARESANVPGSGPRQKASLWSRLKRQG